MKGYFLTLEQMEEMITKSQNIMKKQKETFESGELVEVSFFNNKWFKRYFIGISRNGKFVTENEDGYIYESNHIRKINPAIEQIREIMKKNNISKEEI
jgi:ubiquinone/menaquinone biosynthesis C-methylase UbiE